MLTIDSVIIQPPTDGNILEPGTWFDTPGPLEIEIGCGKGGFLLARARANPAVRFLGVEWANKYFKFCAERIVRRGLANVRVMRTDARYLIQNHLPPDSISILHLYHPDPWPKKRHHKRRLVQPAFAAAVARILRPDGSWYIQTDHSDYFEWIREVVGRESGLTQVPWDDTIRPNDPDWSGTNFEVKYSREGRAIYRIAFAKPGAS